MASRISFLESLLIHPGNLIKKKTKQDYEKLACRKHIVSHPSLMAVLIRGVNFSLS